MADFFEFGDLFEAAKEGDLEQVRFLIGLGANPSEKDYHGSTALHHAISRRHLEVVKFLVNVGSNMLEKDRPLHRTALHIASELGYLEIVKFLVESCVATNVSISEKDTLGPTGRTALHLAIERYHVDIVKFLVESYVDTGVDIGVGYFYGVIPTITLSDEEEEIKQFLIKHSEMQKNGDYVLK